MYDIHDILKMVGCCGTNTEESEDVILSQDLESGVDTFVDTIKGDTAAESEIRRFEESIEKSLHTSKGCTNIVIYVVALWIVLVILYSGYFYFSRYGWIQG
eukprot:1100905_1